MVCKHCSPEDKVTIILLSIQYLLLFSLRVFQPNQSMFPPPPRLYKKNIKCIKIHKRMRPFQIKNYITMFCVGYNILFLNLFLCSGVERSLKPRI